MSTAAFSLAADTAACAARSAFSAIAKSAWLCSQSFSAAASASSSSCCLFSVTFAQIQLSSGGGLSGQCCGQVALELCGFCRKQCQENRALAHALTRLTIDRRHTPRELREHIGGHVVVDNDRAICGHNGIETAAVFTGSMVSERH